MINRRHFLKGASLFTLGSLVACNGNKGCSGDEKTIVTDLEKNVNKNIGLQIYSLGKELYEDLPANMKRLKDMGYSTLELAGYNDAKISGVDMLEFKKIAEDAGLQIISSHVNPPIHEYTKANLNEIKEFWKKTADDHAKLGVKYLIQPGQPNTRSLEETKFVCEVFNEAGKIVKAAGIPFGYHNHEYEFAKVVPGGKEAKFGRRNNKEGEVIYDLFLSETDPSLVFFEMDVYWVVMGQNDPVEFLRKYADRIKVLHVKDRAVLGQSGMMNFEQIFKQFYANGFTDYFVELEGLKDVSQFEGVKNCAEYLKKARFVK